MNITAQVSNSGPTKTSELMIAELTASAQTEGRRETVMRVKAACDALEKEGRPIGKQSVAEKIKKTDPGKPGSNAQYLRNATNKGLGAYIDERESERREAGHPKKVSADSALDKLLRQGGNGDVLLFVTALRERARAAEKQLERAKHLLGTVCNGVDIDAMLAKRPCAAPVSSIPTLTPSSIAALGETVQVLADVDTLAAFHLARDQNGRIRRNNPNGRGPLDPFLSAAAVVGLEELANLLGVYAPRTVQVRQMPMPGQRS